MPRRGKYSGCRPTPVASKKSCLVSTWTSWLPEGGSAYSLYECPPELDALIRQVFAAYPDLVEGEQWYQSDHSLFVQNGRPALAFTSAQFGPLWAEISHTSRDRPELVDPAKLVILAHALHDLLLRLAS